jgi:hypothetical protein
MITSSMESDNPVVTQCESIQVNHVAPVPPHAIWLRRLGNKVYSRIEYTYQDSKSSSNTETRLAMLSSIVQVLHLMLMSLLNNPFASSRICWPSCNHLNQDKKSW